MEMGSGRRAWKGGGEAERERKREREKEREETEETVVVRRKRPGPGATTARLWRELLVSEQSSDTLHAEL